MRGRRLRRRRRNGLAARADPGRAAGAGGRAGNPSSYPTNCATLSWLEKRRDAQVKAAAGLAAFHDFRFTDALDRERHHVQEPHRRRRRQDLQGGALRPRHRHRGRPTSTATAGSTSTSSTRSAAISSGGTSAADDSRTSPPPAGVAVAGKVSVAASFADIDNDGDQDLYVTTVRAGNMLFENDGKGRFKDISAASGLDYTGHSSGAVFFDYDRDGRLDLFLVNVGRYTTDTVGGAGYQYYVGVRRRVLGPSQAGARRGQHPLSQRGRQPLRRRLEGDGPSGSRRGRATPRRSTSTTTAGPISTCSTCRATTSTTRTRAASASSRRAASCSRGRRGARWAIKVFDFNNDGRLDIFVTDMHSDMSDRSGPTARR